MNLPEDMISVIVSFLPFEDAIATLSCTKNLRQNALLWNQLYHRIQNRYQKFPVELNQQQLNTRALESLFTTNSIQMKCQRICKFASLINAITDCNVDYWSLPDGTNGRYGIGIFSRKELEHTTTDEWQLVKMMSESFHWKYHTTAKLADIITPRSTFCDRINNALDACGWYRKDRPNPHYKHFTYRFQTQDEKEEWKENFVSRIESLLDFQSKPEEVTYYQLTKVFDLRDRESGMDLFCIHAAMNKHLGIVFWYAGSG